MPRNSIASSGVSSTSPGCSFHMTERFQLLSASLHSASKTRLQRERRRLPIRDNDAFISTAIAPNGWTVAATPTEIRLYDVEKQDRTREIKLYTSFRIKSLSKSESIRAVAISEDLLAVVTRSRLIVYEYLEPGDVENNVLEDVRIDQKATWNPRSVSILQVGSSIPDQSAAAWVAVGGEGVNSVKLYQYSRKTCWNIPHDYSSTLRYPRNTGLVNSVGFSTFVRNNYFVVSAVTSDNRVVCWKVRSCEAGSPAVMSRSEYDANATQNPSPHRGEITAVHVFESPSSTAYVLVAINQKHGSQLIRSFIAPLGACRNTQWRSLPDVAGRQILSAAASSNGRFLVLVEKDCMRVLTLVAASEGGLRCHPSALEWKSTLGDTAKDMCAISLSVKESLGCIEVTGVDGRAHMVSGRVSVPGMVPSTASSVTDGARRGALELPADVVVRELCGKEVSVPMSEEIHVMLDG